jgi:O-succinylbenzoic acid--CoA ligase
MALTPTTDWLRLAADARPDALAVVTGDERLTYGALDDLVSRTAGALARGFGVGPGTRLGVVCVAERRLDSVLLLWATWRLGAVAVVLDPQSPLLISGSAGMRERLGLFEIVGRVEPDAAERATSDLVPEPGASHTWVPTSGSSGASRAVILTHGNVAAAVAASGVHLGNTSADRWLLALPLFHVGGLSILWRSAAAGGAVVLHDRFDAERVATTLRAGEVTIASLVPTMLSRVLDVDPGPFGRVRAVLVGGAAAAPTLIERGLAAGLPLLATYGLTEACSQVATVAPGEEAASLVSVGRPLNGVTVGIDRADESGLGEIVVDGPTVSPGYAFEPPRVGPHHTGDLGRLGKDGRLVVFGRADDMIVTGGENVAPAVVEAAIAAHPGVRHVVVHGVPDADWGETVVAVVVAKDDGVTAADLAASTRVRLSPAERPRRWRIVADLPLLPNGKFDRRAVRDETLGSPG